MRRKTEFCFAFFGIFFLCFLFINEKTSFAEEFWKWLGSRVETCFLVTDLEKVQGNGKTFLLQTQIEMISPVLGLRKEREYGQVLTYEAVSSKVDSRELGEEFAEGGGNYVDDAITSKESTEKMLQESQMAEKELRPDIPFVPADCKQKLDIENYRNFEDLIQKFYTVDSGTSVKNGQLDIEKLRQTDLHIEKSKEPQILIYHTHSMEEFADSKEGDESTRIVGIGDHLADILKDKYGYVVLHCTDSFDADGREDAYGRALPALQQILEEHPTIEVVIDLHRDEMPEENRLVMNLDGRETARFMFFNGLSRTKKTGDIAYLQNDYLDQNLAFSFQMQYACEEYYPGLARKIYLKGYRYNMHLCPKTLLIELGAQNNTVQEAMNACDPLAHVLDMVLSGEYNVE